MRALRTRLIGLLSNGGLLTGSGLLLIGMTIVNAGNYLFNLILGRWLGPAAFADLSLIVTLFLVVTFITSALQTTTARYAAAYAVANDRMRTAALRAWLTRWAWRFGLALLAIFVIGAPIWGSIFHTRAIWPFIIFAIGIPFYFAQGVDRGLLQGQTNFIPLTISYQTEMWTRLGIGCGLVAAGLSVNGAVAALTLSIVATWAYARRAADRAAIAGDAAGAQAQPDARVPEPPRTDTGVALVETAPSTTAPAEPRAERAEASVDPVFPTAPAQSVASTGEVRTPEPPPMLSLEERGSIRAFALPVVIGLLGQILINNGDVLIVKHYFEAQAAGSYAALALIGRIVFFATWSIVMALFPIVAQRHQRGQPHRQLLALALGLVGVASGLIVVATLAIPALIVQVLFDTAYLAIAPLLWLYAIATALYALANVVISYRLSIGDGFGSVLALVAGIAQTVGLLVAHATLQEIVLVQVIVMGALLVVLLGWDFMRTQQRPRSIAPISTTLPVQGSNSEPAVSTTS